MKYTSSNIVFQEIPSEISLSFEISLCPYHCKGCHTPELRKDIGNELTENVLRYYIERNRLSNKMLISCVLFMGGDQHKELIDLLKVCKSYNLKTALYTGSLSISKELIKELDYVKLGPYIEELGGLDSPITNQVLYYIKNLNLINIKDLK